MKQLADYTDDEIIIEAEKRIVKVTQRIEYLEEELKRFQMSI